MPAAPSNTTGAYASVCGSLALEMETFDQLPPVLRQALRDGAVKWSAIGVARMVGPLLDLPGMDRWQAEQLEMLEREELRSFATLHLRRHGYLLPHVAADVSPHPSSSRPAAGWQDSQPPATYRSGS